MADDTPKKTTVATRITNPQLERLEDYCEKHDLSKSDAVRVFIGRGLDQGLGPNVQRAHLKMTTIDAVKIGLLTWILLILLF